MAAQPERRRMNAPAKIEAASLPALARSAATRLYFIRVGFSGPIKIGVSRDPDRRLVQLQCGSAARLVLLGSVPGGFADEAVAHRHLAAHRVQGEYFAPSPETLELVAMLLRSHADALEAEGLSQAAA